MEQESIRRSLPEQVRDALAAWEVDRAEREAARAEGRPSSRAVPSPRPKLSPEERKQRRRWQRASVAERRRQRLVAQATERAVRMAEARQALVDKGLGYLFEGR